MFTIDFSKTKQSDLAIEAIKLWNNSKDHNTEDLFWGVVGKILDEPYMSRNFLTEINGCYSWDEFVRDAGLWNWFFNLDNPKLVHILNVCIKVKDAKEIQRELAQLK